MDLKKMEVISRALGDPYRLRILEAIKKEHSWLSCTAIIRLFDLAPSTISHHLRHLKDADLLISEKEGRNMRYLINNVVLEDYAGSLSPNNVCLCLTPNQPAQ